MLNGRSAQGVVGLDHLVGGRSILVLTGLGSNPDVQIKQQGIRPILRVSIQDDIRVSLMKVTLLSFPRHDTKLFDPPDGKTGALADAFPLGLALGGRRLDLVIQLGSDQGEVGFFPGNAAHGDRRRRRTMTTGIQRRRRIRRAARQHEEDPRLESSRFSGLTARSRGTIGSGVATATQGSRRPLLLLWRCTVAMYRFNRTTGSDLEEVLVDPDT